MNTNETDRNFQQLFGELKQQDAGRAPAFAVLAQAEARAPRRKAWPWLVPATAALVAAGVFLKVNHTRSHRFDYDVEQWAAFSTWETPSDALWSASISTPSTGSVPDKPDNNIN